MTQVAAPAIIIVKLDYYGHFIVLLGQDGSHLRVADPLRGLELLTPEEFDRRYLFTGFALSIYPAT